MSVENFADRLREHQERMTKRPEIEVVAGKLPEVVDQAEDALIERGLSIYQRGNKLVRPIRAGESAEDGIRSRKGALTLQIVTLPGLCEAFDLAAAFAKYDGRTKSLRPIDCPEKIAKTYLARAGRWRLPELLGIVEAPTLRRDGSILDKPGYDDSSGLLFDPGELEPLEIPEQPSRDEALAALALLTDLIRDFPFKSDADRSVAIAAMLTALIRSSLRSPARCSRKPFTILPALRLIQYPNFLASAGSEIAPRKASANSVPASSLPSAFAFAARPVISLASTFSSP